MFFLSYYKTDKSVNKTYQTKEIFLLELIVNLTNTKIQFDQS